MSDKITLWDLLGYMKADTLAQMAADLDAEGQVSPTTEIDKLYAACWDALMAVTANTEMAMRMIGTEATR